MKDSDPQIIKPVYIHDTRFTNDNEISLIDLALVLARRKKIIAFIIAAAIISGAITAILLPNQYTYSSSIEIGSQIIDGDIKPFESPQTLLAKIQYSFIPQALNDNGHTNNTNKFKIKAMIPENSTVIVIETKGTEDQSEILRSLLKNISNKATQDHTRIFDAIKQNYVASKENTKAELEATMSKTGAQTEEIDALEKKIDLYDSQLANVQNTREILPPMRSNDTTGIKSSLIIVIFTFSGIFLALLTAFITEFVAQVKEKSISSDTSS